MRIWPRNQRREKDSFWLRLHRLCGGTEKREGNSRKSAPRASREGEDPPGVTRKRKAQASCPPSLTARKFFSLCRKETILFPSLTGKGGGGDFRLPGGWDRSPLHEKALSSAKKEIKNAVPLSSAGERGGKKNLSSSVSQGKGGGHATKKKAFHLVPPKKKGRGVPLPRRKRKAGTRTRKKEPRSGASFESGEGRKKKSVRFETLIGETGGEEKRGGEAPRRRYYSSTLRRGRGKRRRGKCAFLLPSGLGPRWTGGKGRVRGTRGKRWRPPTA